MYQQTSEEQGMQLAFGKYKGQSIGDVPEDYLIWASKNLDNMNIVKAIKAELAKRSDVESSMRSALKANPSGQRALDYYLSRFRKAANDEIASSGCDWEYHPSYAEDSAEEQLALLLTQLETEKKRDDIIANYINNNPGLTVEMIEHIIHLHKIGDLRREQFSTDARYKLALEIGARLGSILCSLEW
jgi:hypothetical protein